jgi:hypothetical protein
MEDESCFEIRDNGNFIRLTPIKISYPDATGDWDRNWVDARIEIKAGAFTGEYVAQFRAIDFQYFRKGLTLVYDNLSGVSTFEDIERYLNIEIKGDGIGHFEASCIACDKPGHMANTLEFELHFDQTQIMPMVRQLDSMLNSFPVVGNIWNK